MFADLISVAVHARRGQVSQKGVHGITGEVDRQASIVGKHVYKQKQEMDQRWKNYRKGQHVKKKYTANVDGC